MKTKVTDLRAAYPELSPDKDYPPLKFKSLRGKVSAAEWQARIPGTEEFLRNPFGLTYDVRRLADRLDPSYRN